MQDEVVGEECNYPEDYIFKYYNNSNLIVSAKVDGILHGTEADVVKLTNVNQYSEVDSRLITSNAQHLYKTEDPSGISWQLEDNYVLTFKDISSEEYILNEDKIWLRLSKNGVTVQDAIMDSECNYNFEYYNNSNIILSAKVEGILHGTEANVVKLVNVNPYSEVDGRILRSNATYVYKTANPTLMEWQLEESYILNIKDLGLDGNKVWFELLKNDKVIEDSIIRDGNSFTYNQNGIDILKGTVDAVFRGTLANAVKFVNVNQYSEVNGTPLLTFKEKIFATGNPSGEIWKLYEGYSLNPKDSDLDGNKVWLELSKDEVVVKGDILYDGDTFTYYNSTGALVFTAKVDAVYRGTTANMVQLREVMQFSEVDGRMFVETSPDSWQLFEGYNLTAIEIYWNGSVWLQLSKNNKLVDEGIFYNTFSLINHTTQNTIITGTIKSTTDPVQLTDITQYYEKTGTVMAQWNSKELNVSGSDEWKTLITSLSIKTPPFVSFTYSPENPSVNQTITFNASLSYDQDGNI
ncbi:MAG: S-layer protein domain-containing protein, partial [Methanosarcinales archaeon]